jgi:hypothetical protein
MEPITYINDYNLSVKKLSNMLGGIRWKSIYKYETIQRKKDGITTRQ